MAGKASFNPYIGGDLWQPYIGSLEIGLWLFSWTNKESLSRLNDKKEDRRVTRVSSIATYLQDKLSQFPNNPSEFEPKLFLEDLRQDARKLSAEPNGKELLSFLGKIYISKAQTYLDRIPLDLNIEFLSFSFVLNLIRFASFAIKAKRRPSQDEVK